MDYVKTGLPVALYDIDGFENGNGGMKDAVRRIHREGARAICYLDVGSYEPWRPDMQTLRHNHPKLIGAPLSAPWSDQRWLDFRHRSVVYPIMRKRLDMCRKKHFDGVQFDDLVAYEERNGGGFQPRITANETVIYAVWLANEAHRRGLSAAFENAIEIAKRLQPYYDWAIFEECTVFHECNGPGLISFLRAGKLTGDVEYTDQSALPRLRTWCSALQDHTSGMLKNRLLDSARTRCHSSRSVAFQARLEPRAPRPVSSCR